MSVDRSDEIRVEKLKAHIAQLAAKLEVWVSLADENAARVDQLEDELRRRLDPKVEERLLRVVYEARPFADPHWSRRNSPEQAKERLAEALEALEQKETP